MPGMNKRTVLFFIALGSGSSFTGAAVPHVMARVGQQVSSTTLTTNLGQFPDINEKSQFTFSDFDLNDGGVYLGNSAGANKIVGVGSSIGGKSFKRLFGVHPDLNDKGDAVFAFVDPTFQTHLATQNSYFFAPFTSTINGLGVTSGGSIAINNNGLAGMNLITLTGSPSAYIGASGIITGMNGFTVNGLTLTNSYSVPQNGISDSGEVVFVGFTGSGRHVMTQNRLIYTAGNTIGGVKFLTVNPGTAINNAGTVAFQGVLDDNRSVIFTTDRGVVASSGAVLAGKTIQNVGFDIALDDAGHVGWTGAFVGGGSGMFIDSQLQLKTGDVVDDVTIATLGTPSINTLGNWVVYATFTNGSSGIVALLPEPTTALTTLGGLLLLRRKRGPIATQIRS